MPTPPKFPDADLLAMLPATVDQIAAAAGQCRTLLQRRVNRMHARGILHVSGYEQAKSTVCARIWSRGPGEDAVRPRTADRSFDIAGYGDVTRMVLGALDDLGPMTCGEIERAIGAGQGIVSRTLTKLRTNSPRAGKRVRIRGYVYDAEGERMYPRAVYEIGSTADAKRPRRDGPQRSREWRARAKMLRTTNSVFNLGRQYRVAA